MRSLLLFTSSLLLPSASLAAVCELFPPPDASPDGPEFGLIFVPGAGIPGEAYGPLSAKIQELFPGKLWYGLTEAWRGDFPNPIEIAEAINDCIDLARFGIQVTNYRMTWLFI